MVTSEIGNFYEQYSETLNNKLKESIKLLENKGYFVSPELTFKTGFFSNSNTLAKINRETKIVYVSSIYENRNIYELCEMIVEENEHFVTNISDGRDFQNHFIKLYTNLLLKN